MKSLTCLDIFSKIINNYEERNNIRKT